MTIIDDSSLTLGVTSFLLFIVFYVWTALGLSAVFRKSGEEGWKGWVPVFNLVVLLQLGGLSGWFLLLLLIPIAGQLLVWALLVVACYRINVAFGHGVGLTVVAALLLPLWASILGFGPDRWLGAEPLAGPRRAGAPAYTPSTPVPAAPEGGWMPPPVPPLPARPARSGLVEDDSEQVTDYPSNPPGPPASARRADPVIPPMPPLPSTLPPGQRAGAAEPAAVPPTRADLRQHQPARSSNTPFEPQPGETSPISRRSSPEPQSASAAREWGDFDLGAVSELTGDVTGAEPGAPAPISAVPLRAPADGPPPTPALVTRLPAPPEPPAGDEGPWAPGRSPMGEPDVFPEASGHVSAIVGAPDAGTPRSARTSVSAQHAKTEIPDDPIDETIVTRRRRTPWSLILPSGVPVAITAEVVLLGRRPDVDGTYPGAQPIAIDDGTVSKTHARLELRDDHWYITDLGSTNGVLFATLMGTEVEATPGVEVEAGERFYLGDAEVRLLRTDG